MASPVSPAIELKRPYALTPHGNGNQAGAPPRFLCPCMLLVACVLHCFRYLQYLVAAHLRTSHLASTPGIKGAELIRYIAHITTPRTTTTHYHP
jgi:hypothetical protein